MVERLHQRGLKGNFRNDKQADKALDTIKRHLRGRQEDSNDRTKA